MKLLLLAASLACSLAHAATPAPDLDLDVSYYSKVLTPEGVTRESRYDEKMLRRPGHVWVERVLPKVALTNVSPKQKVAFKVEQHEHKEFNPVVIPRHVILEKNKVRLEYVDAHDKQVIAIPSTEYENVNFDGSWDNSFYLLDPKLVAAIPLSKQASTVAGARWREVEKNGVFQRVLWDEQKQIPLTIESGDRAGTFYRRVDVKPQTSVSRETPWTQTKGYGQKEYSDFLD